MTNHKFHFVRNANASVTTAECGVGINTKRDDNWSESPSGVSCKKCLAKMKKTQDAQQVPEPKKKFLKDKKAIKLVKKIRKSARKFQAHVAEQGKKNNIRFKHATELLNIVEEMLQDEQDGWVDLKNPKA